MASDERPTEPIEQWPNRRIIFLAVVVGFIFYAIFKLPPTINYVVLRLRDILTMLVLAVAFAYFLLPSVKLLERIPWPLQHKAKRDTCTILAMLLVAALFVLLVSLISHPVSEELSRLARLTTEWAKTLPGVAQDWMDRYSDRMPIEWQAWIDKQFTTDGGFGASPDGQGGLGVTLLTQLKEWVVALGGWYANLLKNVVLSGAHLIALLVLPVFAFYFITDAEKLRAGLQGLLPADAHDACARMTADVHRVLQGYVGTLILISIGTGIATAVTLYLAGVPVYLTFGIMAGVSNLIPVVGPVIAGILISAITLLQVSWQAMLVVLAVYLLIQLVSDRLIAPKLMSESSNLHPIVVIIALLAGAEFFGAIGLFVAVPAVAAARVAWMHYRLWAAEDEDIAELEAMLGITSEAGADAGQAAIVDESPVTDDETEDVSDGNC